MLEVEKALQRFAKHVVSRSRANLTRQDKNASRSLYDSLDYEINVSKNIITDNSHVDKLI